jgi:hypothetical protein
MLKSVAQHNCSHRTDNGKLWNGLTWHKRKEATISGTASLAMAMATNKAAIFFLFSFPV